MDLRVGESMDVEGASSCLHSGFVKEGLAGVGLSVRCGNGTWVV